MKIDRTFIKVIEKNKQIEAIVKAIMTIAQFLQIDVVAEGVETEAQLAIVHALQVPIVQGYLFDAPLPAEAIELKWF